MARIAVQTLVFDVLGTVLDESAGMTAAATALVGTEAAAEVEKLWQQGLSREVGAINRGQAPYRSQEALNVSVLVEALAARGLTAAPERIEQAARFGHHLDPFPDSPAAFERLFRAYRLVTLTTASLSQALDMSFSSFIRWHLMLSCELVQAYKPDPRTYTFALERLGLDPSEVLFVAAHPYDLDAAASHGIHTAYIDRAHLPADELDRLATRFTLVDPDLNALADRLLD